MDRFVSRRSIALLLAAILITSIAVSPTTINAQLQQHQQQVETDGGEPAGEATPEQPPNILLIISDDQPFYTVKYTPDILNEIFVKGTTFSDSLISTSLCCPSRASILTGLYAHNHEVTRNDLRLTKTTFFEAIDSANLDYRTAMVGKYLNSQNGDCRKEFDYWVAFPGRNPNPWYNGTNEPLNVNCKWMKFNNTYSTYLLRDYALQFLNATITEGKPFVMQFSPFSVHPPLTPAQEDANMYPNGLPSYYLPPSFNEIDVTDKPGWVQALHDVFRCQDGPVTVCEKQYKQKQLMIARTLASFDRSVEALLNFLESKGELSNTLSIYINDNGLNYGEHQILGKNVHYKESVKAIMGARWDGHIPVGQTSKLVGNIDIAPTIYDVLDLTPPYPLDGQSLLDLWRVGNESWRQSFLLEHWAPIHIDATIVTKEWSYTETKGNKSELYHRGKDPYELNNVWCFPDDPSCAYSWTIAKLAAELRLLRPSWDSDAQQQQVQLTAAEAATTTS